MLRFKVSEVPYQYSGLDGNVTRRWISTRMAGMGGEDGDVS